MHQRTTKNPHNNKKKIWRPNPLPIKWKELKKSPNWRKLKKFEKNILKLGWPNRYLHLSYVEIAALLQVERTVAIRLMKKLERIGLINKKESFVQNKNGKFTKIHKRNYYVFIDAGRAAIEILLNQLFPHRKNTLQKNLTNVRKSKPGEIIGSQDNFEKAELEKVKKSFQKYALGDEFIRAYPGTLRILLEYPLKKIEEILRLIQKKLKKGWRLREFWSFFLTMLKKSQKVCSYFPYLASEYLEASKGKKSFLREGVDTNIIVESLEKLQKTGEKITRNKLARILIYKTQNVKTVLEGICYQFFNRKGTLPMPRAERKAPKKPLKKLVKMNAATGKSYIEGGHINGQDFYIKHLIVGYKEVDQEKQKRKVKKTYYSTNIKSWVGMLIYTLKTYKDCETIHKRFFFKKAGYYE